jgi:flagellar hook-associated protein 3 FlgL
MDRISTNLPNDNMQFYLRERTRMMQDIQSKIAGQSRILNLRDDPIAAAHATRYRSYRVRLERFSDNMQTVMERNRIAEGYIYQTTDIIQRVRELAVQGANGTYAPEDLQHMAVEVDQMLEQVIELANARGSDGMTIFAGDRSEQLPFRAVYGIRASGERSMITDVQYRGTINPQSAEVSENSYIRTNFPGNEVFWAENQRVQSMTDGRDYQVDAPSSILVDGVEIELSEGDTLFTIVAKINESGAAVKAGVDPVNSGITIETTTPHQLWLQDGEGTTVLRDLGLLTDADASPPYNIDPTAQRTGGSLFDMLITLRDQLYAADQEAIGSRGILGVDHALDNLNATLGRLGAINARLEGSFRRNEMEIPEVIQQDSRLTDVDVAEAVMELRLLETTHRAALGAAARTIQPTLLDFLR